MLAVTNKASEQLKTVLGSEPYKKSNLVIYFQGYGWGGPQLGMALEESIDGLEKIENNGITAYIDNSLKEYVSALGSINIDYNLRPGGGGGYTVTIGDPDIIGGCSGNC